MEHDASIIVLLAEGFDGTFIRSVLAQVGAHNVIIRYAAKRLGAVKQVQW